MKKYKTDIIVIIILLIVAASIWGVIHLLHHDSGSTLEVFIGDNKWKSVPLSEDATIEIPGVDGKNILVIKDNVAYMKDADCPDHLCMKQGKIGADGESIICLPHKVVVRVVSEQDKEVDDYAR